MEDQLECKRIMSAIYVLGTKNAQKNKQTKIHCCISMLFNKRVVSKNHTMLERNRSIPLIQSKKSIQKLWYKLILDHQQFIFSTSNDKKEK